MLKLKETLEFEDVDTNRRDDCEHYDRCLNVACAEHWPSFSYSECVRYKTGERKPMYISFYDESTEVGEPAIFITKEERARLPKVLKAKGIKQFSHYTRRAL